jgi:hypothetical protein
MVLVIVICSVLPWAIPCLLRLFQFPNRVFADVIPHLRLDHATELEDLLDPLKEENLLSAPGRKRSRTEQFKRIHLACEIMAQRAHNARVFQEWGDTESERALQSLNPEAGKHAEALIDTCLYYRLNACMIQARLYAWCLRMACLPFIQSPRISALGKENSFNLIDSYTNVEQAAEHLATACGVQCHHVLIRTLGTVREGATPAAWMSEARTLRGGF